MIEIKRLTKRFGSKCVLDCVDLSFPEGQVACVLGKSGVGKSVLLKHLVGLLTPDSGEIYVDGEEITCLSEEALNGVRKKCGMVFQFPALLDSLNAYDNIVFGLRSHFPDLQEGEMRKVAAEKLKLVHLNESILPKFPGEMSFGEQKRVSIARTLAVEPRYLLFDEPTTSLDPIMTRALTKLIQELSRKLGVTCLVVSHDLESAFQIADKIVLLSDGKAVVDGSPQEMKESSHPLARDFLKEMERYG